MTIQVHDAEHAALAEATVAGSWSGGANGTAVCSTGLTGTCTVSMPDLPNSSGSVTFSVSGVTYGDQTYVASENHDPDGDSDGTTIVVSKS